MLTYFLGTALALFLALGVRCVPDDDGYLLPISVKPTAYNLSIALDANRTRFHGSVEIRATALTQTASITLHCEELNITHSELYSGGSGGEAVRITRLGYERDAQRCVFSLAESLTPRTDYVLALNFNGVYDYDLGITKEYYTTTVGTQKMRRWMIQTEFEPTYARRMFPCFDEPAYKARFSLRVGRPQNATVLSNMPLKSSTEDTANGVVWDEFEETPPMSTYLLAFVVFDGDLVNVTDPQTNSSVWLPGEWAQYADRPLYVAAKVVAFLQEYTGVPYSLPKLDHVPIPNPSHDGMENWGLITYRNYYFLYNEALYTLEEKQLMTGFLAHEITHQWFGDLVTMKWWNDTWLKEGFASYFQNYITSVIEPNWRVMEYFCVNTIQAAFYDDVISSALPVSPQSVKTRDEINDMFPIIMYWKGAITVHMLQNILSEETLKNGISHFLKNNAYGSVTEDDLWESLRKVKDNRLDIAEVMHSWIHESGFPLVTVQRENNSILLTQEKYLGKRSETGVRWWIPLTYTTSLDNNFNNTKIKEWFPPNATTHVMDLSFYNNEWIILNIGYTGYYRVNYDMLTWKLLAKYLYQCNANEIPAVTRAQVLDDVFALGASGHVDYKTAFDVAAFLQCETDFLPWATATTVFDSLLNKLYITEAYGLFKTYMLELASEAYSKNSFQNMKSLDEKFTQSFVTPWACKLGHNHCQSTAVQIVSQMMSGENVSIPVDLMETAMCTAVRLGGEKVWSYLHQLYIETNDTANTLYRTHIINALACTLHRGTIHRLLTDIVSEADFINDDGSVFFMAAVANEKQNVPVLIDFLLENFTSVYKLFGVVQILSQLANVQTTAEDSEKMKKIIALLPAKETSASAIAEVLNKIRINDEWMSRHYDTIFQWLKDRQFTTGTTIASGEESTHDNKGSELDQQLYGLTTDLSQEGGPHLDSIPEATTHLLHTTTVKSNSTPVTTSSLLLALQVIICIVIIVY